MARWSEFISEVVALPEKHSVRDIKLEGASANIKDFFITQDDPAFRHVGWVKLSTKAYVDDSFPKVGTE